MIADHASTDATPEITARLARELPAVESLRLERNGRGRALLRSWVFARRRRGSSSDLQAWVQQHGSVVDGVDTGEATLYSLS